MERRNFLKWMGGATAAAATLMVDPEKLLWVPGAKTFFIPETPKIYRPDEVVVNPVMARITEHRLSPQTLREIRQTGQLITPYHRYTVTLETGTQYHFDTNWQGLGGKLHNGVELDKDDADRLWARSVTGRHS